MGLKDYYSHLGAFPRVKAPFLYFFFFLFYANSQYRELD